jgi:ubiquinone/menaquinone biosynthesis C-methylase UbiE
MTKDDQAPRDDFDEYARDYADVLDDSLAGSGAGRDFFAANRVWWVERLETAAGRRPAEILDLGCGDGITEVHLREAFPNATLHGVDVSAESVGMASERGVADCHYLPYDGHRLPFGDASFDVVFVAGVLHHIPEDANRLEVLTEIRRVLKPGGAVYVFEQNPANPVTRRIVDKCPFDKFARLLTARELTRLMDASGLSGSETSFILFAPRHRIFAPIHAIEPRLRHLPIGAQYFATAVKPAAGTASGPDAK